MGIFNKFKTTSISAPFYKGALIFVSRMYCQILYQQILVKFMLLVSIYLAITI